MGIADTQRGTFRRSLSILLSNERKAFFVDLGILEQTCAAAILSLNTCSLLTLAY
jgi:hypothetical protein